MINSLILAAIIFAQAPAVGTGRSGVIEGRLLSTDGTPANGVRVAAVPGEPAPISSPDNALFAISLTDASGHYRLEGLDPGRYRVVAGLLEWLTYYPGVKDGGQSTTIQVAAGSLRTGVDFTLQSPVGVRVSGRVTRLNPRANLSQFVTMNNSSGNGSFQQLQANVAADGAFEFSKVPPGSYQLRINPNVVGTPPVQITVLDKNVGGIEFLVPLLTTVRGRVVVEDGSPAPRVTIGFVSSRGFINAGVSPDSTFSIQVPEGEQRIVVNGLPGVYSLKSIVMGNTNLLLDPLKVGESDVRDVIISFTGPPPGIWLKVKGSVVRPASNPGPIPTKVSLSGSSMPDLEATIAADGTFEFPKVLPGVYTARVQPVNGRQDPVNVNVVRDIDGLEIVMPRQFEVSGRVVVEQDGPMPRLSIDATSFSGNFINAFTGNGNFKMILTEGTYRFRSGGLPLGYSIRSMKSGSVDLLTEPLSAIGTASIPEIIVTIGVSNPPTWRKVSGRIVPPSGSLLPDGIRISLDGEIGNAMTTAKPDGSYEFTRILPGGYRVSLIPPQQIPSTTVTVGASDISGFDIQLPRQLELSGRVIIEGGAPLPPFGVNIARANGGVVYGDGSSYAAVRPPGVFRTMATEGEYRVTVVGLPPAYVLKSMLSSAVDLMKENLKIAGVAPPEIVVTLSSAPPATRKLAGKVLGDTNTTPPLRVLIASPDFFGNRSTEVKPDGSFEFREVVPGAYVMGVAAGMAFSAGTDVRVADTDITNLELQAPRPIEVNLRVTVDGDSRPSNFPVVFLEIRQKDGRGGVALNAFDPINLPLPEGDYDVAIRALPFGYILKSSTYGTTDLQTNPLHVTSPSTSPIRIVLSAQPANAAAGVKIIGQATGNFSIGGPQRVILKSVSADDPNSAGPKPINEASLKTDGSFQFERVPPGTYLAWLMTMPAEEAIRIVVGSKDVTGVELVGKRQAEVYGSVVFEGEERAPNYSQIQVTSTQLRIVPDGNSDFTASGETIGVRVNPDGKFKLILRTGDSRIAVVMPGGYRVKSIFYGDTDLTRQALRIGEAFDSANAPAIRIVLQPVTP